MIRRHSFIVVTMVLTGSVLLTGADQTSVDANASDRGCDSEGLVTIADGISMFEVSKAVATRVGEQGSKMRTLHRMEVFSGEYADGRLGEPLTRVRTSVNRSGQFRFKAKARFSAVEVCRDGKLTRSLRDEPAYYMLRSAGCEDLVLQVAVGWQPHEVVLSCKRFE